MSGNFSIATSLAMKSTSASKSQPVSSTPKSTMKNTPAMLHQVIYISISGLLVNEKNDEIWKTIVHSIESDIYSKN